VRLPYVCNMNPRQKFIDHCPGPARRRPHAPSVSHSSSLSFVRCVYTGTRDA
jgi:hypothetical protein